jgi:hypothetical protein
MIRIHIPTFVQVHVHVEVEVSAINIGVTSSLDKIDKWSFSRDYLSRW